MKAINVTFFPQTSQTFCASEGNKAFNRPARRADPARSMLTRCSGSSGSSSVTRCLDLIIQSQKKTERKMARWTFVVKQLQLGRV